MSKRVGKPEDKQETVLILGGTGEIGRMVIEQLLNSEYKVRAVVRYSSILI
jgi:uncharacterized protein YbjT (DUF2867 family)